MTDNIQKLYEIAGVKKKYCGWLDMGDLDTQYKYVMCDTLEEYKETAEFSRTSYSSDDNNYITPEIKYPPFTAEKQLELIKCLANIETISMQSDGEDYQVLTEFESGDWLATFEQALASLILELWQELTDNQKQEIKEILE